jgi:hypothetical protein
LTVSSDPAVPARAEPSWPTEIGTRVPATPPAATSPPASVPSGASQPIGRLRRVDPVELWRSADFAAWLEEHLEEIGRLIDLPLAPAPRGDAAPGTVVAADPSGGQVRIVVELGSSSDETFGVLMRQLVASGAKTAVWVCARARDEHLSSVAWLNREIDGRLHVVSVDAVRVDDSVPAPILALVLRAGSAPKGPLPAPARGTSASAAAPTSA